jgi:predicted nucleic acid-binding protein
MRLPVTEATVARGDFLACEYNLRSFDALHLATAILWQETIGETVTIATYDTQLGEATRQAGIAALPEG